MSIERNILAAAALLASPMAAEAQTTSTPSYEDIPTCSIESSVNETRQDVGTVVWSEPAIIVQAHLDPSPECPTPAHPPSRRETGENPEYITTVRLPNRTEVVCETTENHLAGEVLVVEERIVRVQGLGPDGRTPTFSTTSREYTCQSAPAWS